MYIKKVIVEWSPYKGCFPSLRILFYNHNGNLFESGSTISSTNVKAETDNFIVTTSNMAAESYYPINAISTEVYKDINDALLSHFRSADYANTFTIEFKTIKQISKIKICTFHSNSATKNFFLDIYDILGNKLSYDGYDTSFTIHEYDPNVAI